MKYLIATLVVLGLVSSARAQGASHVDASAVADVASIAPGKPFKIGVRLKIDPGWHVYWINPGDSGLPTRVKLELPAGYTAGPLEYPTPERIALPGNVVCYGYTDETFLTLTVTPPATPAATGDVTIPVRASWLVCQDDCMPGSANTSITLPIGDGKPSSDATTFDDWAKKLPAPAEKSADTSAVSAIYTPAATADLVPVSVGLTWKGTAPAEVQIAPEPTDGWSVADVKSETTGNKTVVKFNLKKAGSVNPPASFAGIILYKNAAGSPAGIRVEFGTVDVTTQPTK